MNDTAARAAALAESLKSVLGADAVVTDVAEREACSADLYVAGATCALVLRPGDRAGVASAVAAATGAGFAVIARGGGLTYTAGCTPLSEETVVLDLRRLDRIVAVSADDMYVTAEAGVTWKQLHAALAPLGLRLPCFGTFSGAGATVGGGLANGALFFGTARYGTVADALLGLEVVLADGTVLATGQGALANGHKPFYRAFGPDLAGLFVHDAGAFGVKTAATFRLIEAPACSGYASFAFADASGAIAALSAVARAGLAEDAYVFDPETTRRHLSDVDLAGALRALAAVARGQGGLLKGLRDSARIAVAGRGSLFVDAYSLHIACAGRCAAAVASDVEGCRDIARRHGGAELPDSIPKVVRAQPFPPLDDVVGPDGERWAALNAKVAHSDAADLVAAAESLLESHAPAMQRHGITVSRLMIAVSNHSFSYEPVLHWRDAWLPGHRRALSPAKLGRIREPSPDSSASAQVHAIRGELVELFARHGAASNQIGKTYPYASVLRAESRALLESLKQRLDPAGRMNPGALELSPP